MSTTTQSSRQWLRRLSVKTYASATGNGFELSSPDDASAGLHCVFKAMHATVPTPNHLAIRIFNLSSDTANTIISKQDRILVEAGYRDGPFGRIFQGQFYYSRQGRDNPTDTYLDLFAQDGDSAAQLAFLNETLGAGHSTDELRKAINRSMNPYGITPGHQAATPADRSPRGKVLYGSTRDYAHEFARTYRQEWFISSEQLQFLPYNEALPGEQQVVALTGQTGLVGLPCITPQGIELKCLLNPSLRAGGIVQLDNASIQRSTPSPAFAHDPQSGLFNIVGQEPNQTLTDRLLDADGLYKIVALDYEGDTRGNAWYCDMICVALDPTQRPVKVPDTLTPA